MTRKFFPCCLIAVCWLQLTVYAQKRALTHDDVAGWNRLKDHEISPDGKWVAYQKGPDEGDDIVVLYEVSSGREFFIPRGSASQFTFDSRFLVCQIRPSLDSVRALKRLKKKKDDLPKDSLGLFDLRTKTIQKFPNVRSYKLPEKAGGWLAYLTVQDSVGGVKKQPSENTGFTLTVYNYENGRKQSFEFVKEYFFSENGETLTFYSTGAQRQFPSGIYCLFQAAEAVRPVYRSKGVYKDLHVSPDGSRLAFFHDGDTTKKAVPDYRLLYWNTTADSASVLLDNDHTFLREGWRLAGTGLRFSRDNSRLFFATQPLPVLGDTSLLDEEKAKLDIWNYKEGFLQTQQKVHSEGERKRAFDAVYVLSSGEVVQLEDETLTDIQTPKEGNSGFALGAFEAPEYQLSVQWEGSPVYKDIYTVDLSTGKRRLVAKKIKAEPMLSPQGHFGYWFDLQDTAWYAVEMATGALRKITSNTEVSFADEENDLPNYPAPYGIAGWLTDDSYILVYDRFDIWKIDPKNPDDKINLTKNGRSSSIVYRYVKTDPDELNIPAVGEILLKGRNKKTRQQGFFSMGLEGESNPKLLILEHAQLNFLKKAREADKCLITKETFQQFPDLQLSTLKFGKLQQVSKLNPQQSQFLWGSEELVEWTSLDGIRLEGLLFKPENFDPAQKYPMLVYFYEKNSDNFHKHWAPEYHRSTINFTFYTSRGYLVFVPDIVYKIGYPGESAINCVMPGVTALIEKGFVDKDRVGVQGHSWGGYQIAYMITRTQLFRAAEAGAPVPNMTSAYGGIRWETGLSRMFQYEHTQSRIGGSLWEYPLRFLENSPLFWLDKVQTPLLIMHNDADGHVPWYQGIELFVGLRRLGKPSWMITYNEQPHWPLLYPNRKDWAIRMQQFFDHYLKDAPMPVWMDKGVPAKEKGINYGLELTEDQH